MRAYFFPLVMLLLALFVGASQGFNAGKEVGRIQVASGDYVCQQALEEWVCKEQNDD